MRVNRAEDHAEEPEKHKGKHEGIGKVGLECLACDGEDETGRQADGQKPFRSPRGTTKGGLRAPHPLGPPKFTR